MKQREWCVHYAGLSGRGGVKNTTCKAGVCYTDVARPLTGEEWARMEEYDKSSPYGPANPDTYLFMDRLPCFESNTELDTCPDRRFPTAEEIAEREREFRAAVVKVTTVRAAIVEHLKENNALKRSVSGRIRCPLCGGMVHFGYAGSYNRHISAKCETPGCVDWME